MYQLDLFRSVKHHHQELKAAPVFWADYCVKGRLFVVPVPAKYRENKAKQASFCGGYTGFRAGVVS